MSLLKSESSLTYDIKVISKVFASSQKEVPLFYSLLNDFIREQLSFNTQKAYLRDILQFATWLAKTDDNAFTKVKYKTALAYRDYVRSFGGRVVNGKLQEASKRTVHRKISAISAFYQFVSRRYLEAHNKQIPNPFSHIKLQSVDNSQTVTEALTKDELCKFMNYLNSIGADLTELRDKAILMIGLDAIIRSDALINLKGSDFYSHGDRFKLKYTDKGGKEFDEILHPNTANAIINYLKAMKESKRELFDCDPLFIPITNPKEVKSLSKNMPSLIVKAHMKRAGITIPVSFHTLKATVSSEITDRFGAHIAQRKAKHAKLDQIVAYHGKRRSREVPTSDKLSYLD
jgi:site-specific recombinase XerD